MKNISTFILFSFMFWAHVLSQTPDTLWTKSFGGNGEDWIGSSVTQTDDNGFIMAGWYDNGDAADVWLLKTDANGDTLWTKTFGGSEDDMGSDIVITPQGDYVIAAITHSYGAGEDDWWLIKTDADGNMIWNKTYGGIEEDEDVSIEKTSDGGFILTGQHTIDGDGQVWLVKTDSNGNVVWDNYAFPNAEAGSVGHCVRQTTDGGYIIVGENDDLGIWLIKTDPSGNMEWNNAYGGSEPCCDEGYIVEQTSDNGFILGGETLSFGPNDSTTYAWLIKTDEQGDTLWTQKYFQALPDSIGASVGYGNSLMQTEDGGYLFTGFRGLNAGELDLFLTKTDENGTEQWTEILENAAGMCLTQTAQGNIMVGGLNPTSEGDMNIFLSLFNVTTTGIGYSDYLGYKANMLYQNYPNPFFANTIIPYKISQPGQVSLKIYDSSGQLVQTVTEKFHEPGTYVINIQNPTLRNGFYYYTLQVGNDFVGSRKMLMSH